ncbi:MAG: hypothetical protein ACAI38_17200 [Myxococcota bacterium]
MSGERVGSKGAKTVGWENEGVVERGNDKRVRDSFAQAKASGAVKLTPLQPHQVTALKAEMNSGSRTHGDRSVDLGNGEQLIQRNGKVYLRAGEQYSSVSGYSFPPLPMAQVRF